MKKLLNLALAGAVMLAALACQREPGAEAIGEENGVKDVVTQFVLNITAAPSTKMTADMVQLNQNFRGIQDAYLYVYNTGIQDDDDDTKVPYVLRTDAAPSKEFDFSVFFASGGLDNTGNAGDLDNNNSNNNYTGANSTGDNATVASKRVLQLEIPVGVDAVMFYGKATKGASDKTTDAAYGATNYGTYNDNGTKNYTVISGKPSETIIAAKKILYGTEKVGNVDVDIVDRYDDTGFLMISIVNNILQMNVPDGEVIVGGEQKNAAAVAWSDYGHKYELEHATTQYPSRYTSDDTSIDHNLQGLEEILGKCYYLFTYFQPVDANIRPNGDYRGGSSASVRKMITDMYKVISAAAGAEPTDVNEANAKRLARAILDRAELFIWSPAAAAADKQSSAASDAVAGNFKSVGDIKTVAHTNNVFTTEYWNANFIYATDLNQYPYEYYGIPEGAAQLGFVKKGDTHPSQSLKSGQVATTDEFFYYHPNHPLVNPAITEFEPRKYLYPAELWYYTNSPVRTTIKDVEVKDYPDGVNKWNTSSSWTAGQWQYPGKVASNTRGVAVTSSINYGVALLKSTVQYSAGTLYDNRNVITRGAEANRQITAGEANLQLRGILVGGVNPRMNWQFLRKYETTESQQGLGDLSQFDGVIYDHSIPDAAKQIPSTGAASGPNYTLVYDNYNSTAGTAGQNDVYIALEFVNGGVAFYGRDNLIPQGGVFYLVGHLELPSDEINWPADHEIPPLKGIDATAEQIAALGAEYGKSEKIPRIFIQDFMTTAAFKIGANSLQHAYYSVPDLRASQMSLGLSVDLQWNSGLVFSGVDL